MPRDELTTEQRIAKRGNRISFDTNRNAYAADRDHPYSPRGRPCAPVATSIEFAKLGKIKPARFNLRGIRNRMAQKPDPWPHIYDHAQPAGAAQQRLDHA